MCTPQKQNKNFGNLEKTLNFGINKKSFDKLNSNSNFVKTKEILFNQKTFYEILLGFIKKTQLKYLNTIKSEKDSFNIKQDYNQKKEIIINLKEDLSTTLTEKQFTLNYVKKIYSKKKKEVQDLVFPSTECKRKQKYSEHEPISTENNEKYEKSEINQIKCMNFRIENEISNINYFINKKKYIIEYLKNFELVIEDYKEIICENNRDKKEVTNILHSNLVEVRRLFIEKVFQNTQNNLLIGDLESRIKLLCECDDDKNKLHNSLDVIPEESKDFTQSIILNNNNNNLLLINSRKSSIKCNSNDNICQIPLCNEQQMNINDIKKYLNLNMNINVNINVNNVNNQYVGNALNFCEINKNEKENSDDKNDKKIEFHLNECKQSILNIKKEEADENKSDKNDDKILGST